jgi:hypothetical protein
MEIIEEGQLQGAFKGFHNRETVFKFVGGGKWRQNIYQYYYQYAYMPSARVVERDGTCYLEVEDIDKSVEVVRIP